MNMRNYVIRELPMISHIEADNPFSVVKGICARLMDDIHVQ